MADKNTNLPSIIIEQSPNFSVIYVDGTFGGVSADQSIAWIQFFQDIPHNEVVSSTGNMVVKTIRREMLMDLRMSTTAFRGIAKWMNDTVKQMDSNKK